MIWTRRIAEGRLTKEASFTILAPVPVQFGKRRANTPRCRPPTSPLGNGLRSNMDGEGHAADIGGSMSMGSGVTKLSVPQPHSPPRRPHSIYRVKENQAL
jgi:hypothetical protein